MKTTILKYILMAAAVLMAAACQEGLDQISTEGDMGYVTLNITPSEHTRAPFAPEELRVRIYDKDDRLVRLYTEGDDIPEKIALVAGDYTFKVEARDKDHTTAFKGSEVADDREKIYYIGEKNVPVTAGKPVDATIVCDPQHVRVGVTLSEDDGENELLSDVKIALAPMSIDGKNTATDKKKKTDFDNAYKDGNGIDKLEFEVEDVADNGLRDYAYFLLPEDEKGPTVETIAWVITAKHTAAAENEGDDPVVTSIDKAGQIVVEKGKAYELQFRYSQLSDGSITVTVTVDYSVDGEDHNVAFKPQPEIKPVEGNNWTEGGENVFVVGEDKSFTIESINSITALKVNEVEIWSDTDTRTEVTKDMFEVTPEDDNKKFTVKVKSAYFATLAGGEQDFKLSTYDRSTEVGKFDTKFLNQGLVVDEDEEDATSFDMWSNKADFVAVITAESVSSVVVKYKNVNASVWNEATAAEESGGKYVAKSLDPWITRSKEDANPVNAGYTVYQPDTAKGFYAGSTYQYQLFVNGSAYGPIYTKTLTTTQTIPYATFEDEKLDCFKVLTDGSAKYWGSGSNNFATLCFREKFNGESSYSAKLQAAAAGLLGITKLAAGNLFTGNFKMDGTTGTVSFGVKYEWEARPTALKLRSYYDIGAVDRADQSGVEGTDTVGGMKKKDPDQGSIYVAIVNWNSRHQTSSGTSAPTGVWSVENGPDAVKEGKIIGYGVIYPKGKTEGDSMVDLEIPIYYYDTTTKPDANFTLVISAATSRYGDYMIGCSKSTMYVDDFEWVY